MIDRTTSLLFNNFSLTSYNAEMSKYLSAMHSSGDDVGFEMVAMKHYPGEDIIIIIITIIVILLITIIVITVIIIFLLWVVLLSSYTIGFIRSSFYLQYKQWLSCH
jgi:uncharacterized membrane protein SpoIIM required for sporulation